MARHVRRRLAIECGAAETRAALIDEGGAVSFWFGPAIGDEALPAPVEEGAMRLGRVKTMSRALRGGFIDIGEPDDAFLPIGASDAAPTEGAVVIVRVKRPAIGRKGAVVTASWRRDLPPALVRGVEEEARQDGPAPRALGPTESAAVRLARKGLQSGAEEILVDHADAATALAAAGIKATFAEDAVCAADIGSEIDSALAREIVLANGARLTFDESEALTAVDLDMAGAASTATADAVNVAASSALFRELSRRAIGGRVVIDLLPPSSPQQRAVLERALADQDRDLYPRRAGRLARDGLYDLTAPRLTRSLLERASEPAGAGLLREGRRATLRWCANAAICALERALRRSRTGFITLLAAGDLTAYLAGCDRALARVRARFGARFSVEEKLTLKDRSFDVVERPAGR